MLVLGGVVSAFNFLLSLVVGLRLLRLGGRSSDAPELWLGLYFLLSSFLGMGLSCFLYVGWVDASISLSKDVEPVLHLIFLASWSAGNASLYVFTWRTFRPRSAAARALTATGIAVMFGGLVGMGASEGFELRPLNGPAYWISFAARTGVLLWLAGESFRYWRMLRRRLRLGLADPVLTNRFLLWSVWAATVFLLGQADPLARLWYVWTTGSAEQLNLVASRSIVLVMVATTSLLGIVMAATVLLTFFPTPRYRRWLEGRAQSLAQAGAT